MEGINPLLLIVILSIGGIILYFLQKLRSDNSYKSLSSSKNWIEVSKNSGCLDEKRSNEKRSKISGDLKVVENPIVVDKDKKAEISQKSIVSSNPNLNLVNSETQQQLPVFPEQPIGNIVKNADKLYSDIDLKFHDLNTMGRIQKTIARVRAKHNPIYKNILFSENDLTDNNIDSSDK